jgi:hypothetical protein
VLLVGVMISVRLVRQRSHHAYTGWAGVLLAVFAILTGFSIGPFIAPLAALLIAVAAGALEAHHRPA